ncbi:UPF0115 protein YfcN [Serratia symbiotica]|nr:UPF0115 protein YfcN [Serratia symbiotica]
MKTQLPCTKDEQQLFREAVAGAKKLPQDAVVPHRSKLKLHLLMQVRVLHEQVNASYYFSEQYQSCLKGGDQSSYIRHFSNPCELRKLRRGEYSPDLFLDLHGLTQVQAKQELGALIAACKRENVRCASVMHGHGKHILKQYTPLWLGLHPDVLAFHQAPKTWGGNAAILLLVKLAE